MLLPVMTEQSWAEPREACTPAAPKGSITALHITVRVYRRESLLCWGVGVEYEGGGKHLLFAHLILRFPAGPIWLRGRDLSCRSTALLGKLLNKTALGSHALSLPCISLLLPPKAHHPPWYLSHTAQPPQVPEPCSPHTLWQLSSPLALC